MSQTLTAPALVASAFWMIDGLITGFTHEATADSVRYYFPKALHVEPLTYEQAHEEDYDEAEAELGSFRYSYSDRNEWWGDSPCAA